MHKLATLLALSLLISIPAYAQRTARPNEPVAEVFGGFAEVHLTGNTVVGNAPGLVGSVAWNALPWLQLVADTSYNTSTSSGNSVTLYGNHYGPRVFYKERNKWRASPFAEFLIGGSHINSKLTGATTPATDLALSYKIGGGLDYNLSPHFAVRVFEADLYRTGLFGSHQNNLWATAGFVIRFGGASPQ
jgi:hypothetical protein